MIWSNSTAEGWEGVVSAPEAEEAPAEAEEAPAATGAPNDEKTAISKHCVEITLPETEVYALLSSLKKSGISYHAYDNEITVIITPDNLSSAKDILAAYTNAEIIRNTTVLIRKE